MWRRDLGYLYTVPNCNLNNVVSPLKQWCGMGMGNSWKASSVFTFAQSKLVGVIISDISIPPNIKMAFFCCILSWYVIANLQCKGKRITIKIFPLFYEVALALLQLISLRVFEDVCHVESPRRVIRQLLVLGRCLSAEQDPFRSIAMWPEFHTINQLWII